MCGRAGYTASRSLRVSTMPSVTKAHLMSRDEGISFCRRLVESTPALSPILAEHLSDNFGEILPHHFVADVSRWHLARIRQGDLVDAGELATYVDREYVSGSPYVQDLLAASFIESLPWEHEEESLAIRSTLGPALQARQREMWSWRPSRGTREA